MGRQHPDLPLPFNSHGPVVETSHHQQFHMVLTGTELSSEMMAVNVLSCTPYFLALQNRNWV